MRLSRACILTATRNRMFSSAAATPLVRSVLDADVIRKADLNTDVDDISADMPEAAVDLLSFESLGLNNKLCSYLTSKRLKTPSPVQEAAIPHGLAGQSIIAQARTGTGKTLAFTLPLLQRLRDMPRASGTNESRGMGRPRCVILAPTRELAIQVCDLLILKPSIILLNTSGGTRGDTSGCRLRPKGGMCVRRG